MKLGCVYTVIINDHSCAQTTTLSWLTTSTLHVTTPLDGFFVSFFSTGVSLTYIVSPALTGAGHLTLAPRNARIVPSIYPA